MKKCELGHLLSDFFVLVFYYAFLLFLSNEIGG